MSRKPAAHGPARTDETGVELKRGAFQNTIAMLASNFRGIFTFLVARLLRSGGAWYIFGGLGELDFLSKIAVFGLDNAITTFVARSQARSDSARSRTLFRTPLSWCSHSHVSSQSLPSYFCELWRPIRFPPEMVSALAFVLCALPGLGFYRDCTSISRGMKVMKHDIFSRGITEPTITRS